MNQTLTMFFFLTLFPLWTPAQQQDFRVMSYNVENLFDTTDNPQKEDNDFLSSGNRHWTNKRYYHKLQQIAKVIIATGEWDTPALVGLCEVENDTVLTHLLHRTPLRLQNYHYCMTHGNDIRGINVALLYQQDKFGYLGNTEYPVRFSRKKHKHTRNILHVWGKVISGDTLDVFVCHFPSRYGGEKESETDRFDAALTLHTICDSLHQIRKHSQILIMGDFNDTPENESIRKKLIGEESLPDSSSLTLHNIYSGYQPVSPLGSHKYQGEWSKIDQVIISSSLTDSTAAMHTKPNSFRIYAPPFLLIKDKTWRGERPFRTYYGFKYEGGYSDHLPLLLDFTIRVK